MHTDSTSARDVLEPWQERLAAQFESETSDDAPPATRPNSLVDIVPAPQAQTAWPRLLAQRCFGNPELVFDVTRQLLAVRQHYRSDDLLSVALSGLSLRYEPPPGVSLARFIETHRRGVVVFDDLQCFPEHILATLANVADTGIACSETGNDLPASELIILSFARVRLPSPRELAALAGRDEPWPCDNVPWPARMEFSEAIRTAAEAQYPEHFANRMISLLGHGPNWSCVWERYISLVQRGALDEPLYLAPTNVPQPLVPQDVQAEELADDVEAITAHADEGTSYDVFISYSWKRKSRDAEWLRDRLRERGLRVYFDKDEIGLATVPADRRKATLIRHLAAAASASRAWVLFAIQLEPYRERRGVDLQTALRSGLAMRVDAWASPTEWSWQAFEMRHMGRRLVIYDTSAHVVSTEQRVDRDFGEHPAQAPAEILAVVERYLVQQGVLPTPAPR